MNDDNQSSFEEDKYKEAPLNPDSPDAALNRAMVEAAKSMHVSDLVDAMIGNKNQGIDIEVGKKYLDAFGDSVEIIGAYESTGSKYFVGITGRFEKSCVIYNNKGQFVSVPGKWISYPNIRGEEK